MTQEDLEKQKKLLLNSSLFINNIYFKKYIKLIQCAILTQSEYNKKYLENHHVFPRCISKYIGLKVDNTKHNLIYLDYINHMLAHYYLCLSSNNTYIFKKLSYPIKFLFGKNSFLIKTQLKSKSIKLTSLLKSIQKLKNKEKEIYAFQRDKLYKWFNCQFQNNKTLNQLDKENDKPDGYFTWKWYSLINDFGYENTYPFKVGTEQYFLRKSKAVQSFYQTHVVSEHTKNKQRKAKLGWCFENEVDELRFIKHYDYYCLFGQTNCMAKEYKINRGCLLKNYKYLCKKHNLLPLCPPKNGRHICCFGKDDAETLSLLFLLFDNKITNQEIMSHFKLKDSSSIRRQLERIQLRHPNWQFTIYIPKNMFSSKWNFLGKTDWEKFNFLYKYSKDDSLAKSLLPKIYDFNDINWVWTRVVACHPTWPADIHSGKLVLNQPIIPQLLKRLA